MCIADFISNADLRRHASERITLVPLTDDVLAQFDYAAEEQRHRFFGLEMSPLFLPLLSDWV